MASVLIVDETSSGERLGEIRLSDLSDRVTARELIERRVAEEVRHYNLTRPIKYQGLVQPTEVEATLNQTKTAPFKPLDPDAQAKTAVEAFERNRFFILVGDRQVENLDDEIELKVDTEISFLRLTPLIGG